MHSFVVGLALCLCFVASVQSQVYRDPCRNKQCGNYGCCVRRDPYYQNGEIFYRRAICACDEHFYYHRSEDECKHGCYQNNCHEYASCTAKGRGDQYPGYDQWNIYLNEYYYCTCNQGYRGNGRVCDKIDPCETANCHQYATCHAKAVGSRDYPHYSSFRGYVQNAYYCQCQENYYGNGRQCTHGCDDNTCHARYATCSPKGLGLDYPGSSNNRIYRNNYYYCQCNQGYQGNGRQCDPFDPCDNADCHRWATCHHKSRGSRTYPGYNSYNGYEDNAYYCQCRNNYYGNGRQCTLKCSQHNCDQYATCIPKNLGLDYPGSHNNNIYRNNYYYCQCNNGYSGNGRRCSLRVTSDPCRRANCHEYATCHTKQRGSTNYYNFPQYRGYVNNAYYCRCRQNYYGNGRDCTPHCTSSSCHSTARCIPKEFGSTDYPTYHLYPTFTDRYYYCDCPRGYWDGTRCQNSACHACHDDYAQCFYKRCGSTDYPSYGNDRFYEPLCYYCACKKSYFGNGRSCLRNRSG